MTSESAERKYFNRAKASLAKHLGTKAMYDDTIDAVGKRLFPTWAGVFPVDQVRILPFHYCVINTDKHNEPGQHWIAMYTTAKCAYIYDSYGRDPFKLVPLLIQTIKQSGMKLCKTNLAPHGEQIGFTSELCGVYSLAFLMTVKKLGIERAKNI